MGLAQSPQAVITKGVNASQYNRSQKEEGLLGNIYLPHRLLENTGEKTSALLVGRPYRRVYPSRSADISRFVVEV